MTKVLIIGGTRFFGKKLVEQLIRDGVDVTIITRGQTRDSFGNSVKRLQADRTDQAAMQHVLGSSTYDVVYDNICYTPQEAEAAVELFTGRTQKYIVTSSLSIYPFGGIAKIESDFDPYSYTLPEPYPTKIDYAEGKRLVEAVFCQKASFKVAAVRFPVVLGLDDYTRRLHFHVEHVAQGLPLGIPNLDAEMSFIRSDEAADFLAWLGRSNLEGPVNATSNGVTSLGRILSLITEATGQQAHILTETDAADRSPFGIPETWFMNTAKAEAAGFKFQRLDDWLPELIREISDLSPIM
ncbi:NAD-dependent epimerase/dehydratase family protein [Paenibacillus monticola]|uniref:NAD-dependent epimerase/dehydratase family protein n=1 Tax=Paenibacillus monticola TaxID=2666075 RepID=A0A7X2H1C0_9BACL|nr:NAD-dependent epimerase/dehydratase family protein [Paenibacillus monticola]MRN51749.1 NAD-dependent epimerase/dehydratase family protein [Paenibacillus monticola]